MASKAIAKIASGGVVPISKKHTVPSSGIWELIRRVFAVDPNRSTGVPLNPYFRNPPPGAETHLDRESAYEDPVTVPAADLADNPYWKRDARRAYPRLSVVRQTDAAALLGVGSAAAPRTELIGEAGEKALVEAKDGAEQQGLAHALARADATQAVGSQIFVNGLPPLPSGQSMRSGKWDVYDYELTEEQSFTEDYPCRSFR